MECRGEGQNGGSVRILAVDPGIKLGYALQLDWGVPLSGVQRFEISRDESPGMRWLRFRAWLKEVNEKAGGIGVIYHERPHHRGGAATAILEGFVSQLQAFAAEHRIEIKAVHSGTLKKFGTGSGAAGKPQMMAAAGARYPDRVIIDDNEADALILLDFARKELRID